MKTQNITSSPSRDLGRKFRSFQFIAGAAACMCLSSCIEPYGEYGRVSSYHQPGHRVQSLPSGYRSETISGNTYYYHDGNYYRRTSGGYEVSDAPRGSRYYSDYGRLRQDGQGDYRYDDRDQRYGSGEVIYQLPRDHRVVTHRGTTYYQVGERFYIRKNGAYYLVRRPF